MGLGLTGMAVLVGAYLILAAVFAYEGKWAYCSYWIGASIITASVLVMR